MPTASRRGSRHPHPPITIGGDGEKRTLRSVARFAQKWNTPFTDATVLRHKQEVLAGHCADVGRDPGEIEITAQVIYIGTRGHRRRRVSELADAGCQTAIVYLPEDQHAPAVLGPLAEALTPLHD